MAVLHRIKAYLQKNPLTEDPDDYVFRVQAEKTLNVKDICETANSRGAADVTAAAMQHSVELFLKEMNYQLCDGYSVNTGSFTASAHIKGTAHNPDEKFDPDKHHFLFELHQGAELRKEAQSVTIEVLGVAPAKAHIAQVLDVKSKTTNELLTKGRNLVIKGEEIKVTGTHDSVGVWFVCQDPDATLLKTKVQPDDIVTNNPSEVIIVIPELTGSTYKLEITTNFSSGGGQLKNPRTLNFDKLLIVVD